MPFSNLPHHVADWHSVLAAPLFTPQADTLVAQDQLQHSGGVVVLLGEALTREEVQQVVAELARRGISWQLLAPFVLDEVQVLVLALDRHEPELAHWLKMQEWPVDGIHVERLPRLDQPGLILMDMDSTAIQIECIDEIARLAGVGEQVAAVTAAAMQGKLEFADSLRSRVALLEGAPVTILDEVAAAMPWMPGLQLMVDTLKQSGWTVAIASGGFTRFAGELQQALGLDAIFANELAVEGGLLTGKVSGRIVDAAVKAEVLQQLARQHEIPVAQTVAVGDGANDLKMMGVAGLGIAIHAKPLVRAQAAATLNHHDLEGVLCLLGALACRDRRWS